MKSEGRSNPLAEWLTVGSLCGFTWVVERFCFKITSLSVRNHGKIFLNKSEIFRVDCFSARTVQWRENANWSLKFLCAERGYTACHISRAFPRGRELGTAPANSLQKLTRTGGIRSFSTQRWMEKISRQKAKSFSTPVCSSDRGDCRQMQSRCARREGLELFWRENRLRDVTTYVTMQILRWRYIFLKAPSECSNVIKYFYQTSCMEMLNKTCSSIRIVFHFHQWISIL